MRITRIRAGGILRFVEPLDVDLDDLGPGLIAFVGKNGSGKTSALETIPAALYGDLPSRAQRLSLYDRCLGRDAHLELEAEDGGSRTRLRVTLDASARKAEYIAERDGETVVNGKKAPYMELISGMFGSRELLLASRFAAQNKRGGILQISRAKRKELFGEMLGHSRLQELSKRAARAGAAIEGQLAEARGGRAELLALAVDEFDLAGALDLARADHALAVQSIEKQRKDLAAREARRDAAAEARAALDALRTECATAQAEVDALRSKIDRGRDAYAAATRRADDLLEALEMDPGPRFLAESRERHEALVAALDQAEAQAESLIAQRDEIERAVKELPELRRELLAIGAKDGECALLGRQFELHEKTSGLIGDVPCGKAERWAPYSGDYDGSVELAGTCPLLASARTAKAEMAEISESLEVLRAGADERKSRAKELAAAIERDEGLAAQRSALEHALARREQNQAERQRLAESLEERETKAAEMTSTWQARRQEIEHERRDAKATHESQEADSAAALAQATVRLDALKQRIAEAPAYEDLTGAIEEAQQLVGKLYQDLETASASVAQFEQQLAAAQEAAKKAEELLGRTRDLEAEVSEWTLLAEACGPNGISQLLIDQAGPEIAAIANSLMAATWGGRFSIRFETLRPLARGDGFAEVFDIRVYDAGKPRDAEDLSGGEQAVLSEAISIAVAIFDAHRSGLNWLQLFRDETAGALDPEAAQNYVAMLRSALAIGGFHQIVFVAHQQEVWQAADARVYFDAGRASIQPPEGYECAAAA